MKNIESIAYSPVRKKANKNQFAFESFLSENKDVLKREQENKLLIERENRNNSFDESSILLREDNSIEKNIKKINKNNLSDYILGEAFANIVYEALLLDEEYKKSNKKYIFKEASNSFIAFKNSGILQEGSYLWKNYISTFNESLKPLQENYDNSKAILQILESIELESFYSGADMSDIVYNKVADMLKEEKYITSNKVKLMESNKKFDGNTLFNTLLTTTYNLKESDEVFKVNDKNKKMSIAFSESLIAYTILETFNTFNLVDLNQDTVRNMVKEMQRAGSDIEAFKANMEKNITQFNSETNSNKPYDGSIL